MKIAEMEVSLIIEDKKLYRASYFESDEAEIILIAVKASWVFNPITVFIVVKITS